MTRSPARTPVTQLIAAIRRVARDVPAADEIVTQVSARPGGHDYSHPGKPQIAWDDPAARDELVTALVTDALAVLAELEGRYPPREGLEPKAGQGGGGCPRGWGPLPRRGGAGGPGGRGGGRGGGGGRPGTSTGRGARRAPRGGGAPPADPRRTG